MVPSAGDRPSEPTRLALSGDAAALHLTLHGWDPDAILEVEGSSGGFRGADTLHVARADFLGFCRALVGLHATLRGEATLRSAWPDALEVRIRPAGSLGQVQVTVRLRSEVTSGHFEFPHEVAFGFVIDPTSLERAARAAEAICKGAT